MTTTLIDQTIQRLRTEAAAIRDDYRTTISDAKDNPRLSSLAVREDVRKAHSDATTKLTELLHREDAAIETAIRTTQEQINRVEGLGLGADMIAFRDAQDRAARVDTSSEALDIMHRAVRSKDKTLATALAHRAVDRSIIDASWQPVLAKLAESYPETAALFNDLAHIERHRAADNMNRWVYQAPTLPTRY